MSNAETSIQNEILLAIGGRQDVLAWRQQVGKFRAMDNPNRIVSIGTPGLSDIMAVVAVTITQDMVGKTIGVAVAHEVKTLTGSQRDGQKLWQLAFEKRGGVYLVSRSPEQAVAAIENLPELIIGRR